MEKSIKRLIVATALASALVPATGIYAMDSASFAHASEAREEDRKDEVFQEAQLARGEEERKDEVSQETQLTEMSKRLC